ncbi:MAG: hypothetical protein ACK55I_30390, partial [bacterium]
MRGLAQLEVGEVRRVHRRADAVDAGGHERRRILGGQRSLGPRPGEQGQGVDQRSGRLHDRRRPRAHLQRDHGRRAQRRPGAQRHLTGHAVVAVVVPPVGEQLDREQLAVGPLYLHAHVDEPIAHLVGAGLQGDEAPQHGQGDLHAT